MKEGSWQCDGAFWRPSACRFCTLTSRSLAEVPTSPRSARSPRSAWLPRALRSLIQHHQQASLYILTVQRPLRHRLRERVDEGDPQASCTTKHFTLQDKLMLLFLRKRHVA